MFTFAISMTILTSATGIFDINDCEKSAEKFDRNSYPIEKLTPRNGFINDDTRLTLPILNFNINKLII